MKYDLDQKIKDIERSGAYTLEQIRTIKYAMGIIGIDEDLIMNPNIPSEHMDVYIRLMKKGIDVRKYIYNNWELHEVPADDLEKAIMAKNKKVINNATVFESTPEEDKKAIVIDEYPVLEQPKQKILGRK